MALVCAQHQLVRLAPTGVLLELLRSACRISAGVGFIGALIALGCHIRMVKPNNECIVNISPTDS